jgi:hypothetical protein
MNRRRFITLLGGATVAWRSARSRRRRAVPIASGVGGVALTVHSGSAVAFGADQKRSGGRNTQRV